MNIWSCNFFYNLRFFFLIFILLICFLTFINIIIYFKFEFIFCFFLLVFWLLKNCIYCGIDCVRIIDLIMLLLLGSFFKNGSIDNGLGLLGFFVLLDVFKEFFDISKEWFEILLGWWRIGIVFGCLLIGEYVLVFLFWVVVVFDGIYGFLFNNIDEVFVIFKFILFVVLSFFFLR